MCNGEIDQASNINRYKLRSSKELPSKEEYYQTLTSRNVSIVLVSIRQAQLRYQQYT